MPRRERLDFKDAIHYVRVRGREGPGIFFDADILTRSAPRQHALGLQRFESLVASICAECGTVLHGYSVEPNFGILVLQAMGMSLADVMQRLCGRYSRYSGSGAAGQRAGGFASRYESKVVAPEYLPHAVRRAHRSPILAGLCKRRMDYPFSSERAYTGERSPLPLEMTGVRTALEQKGYFGLRGYQEFMDLDESPYVANLFARGSPQDSRIVGSKLFVQQVRQMAAHPAPLPTRRQLIAGAARLLRVTDADIFSATRTGVLGRALVAWYGLRSGAATLTEMGRWFSVTGATLGQAMRRHRKLWPYLFALAALPGSSP
jgi:hypothetical protein